MNKQKAISKQRTRRRTRVRNKLRGSAGQPRMSVFRSHRHIACQLIDDTTGKTLVSAGTSHKALRDNMTQGGNKEAAQLVGKAIAERALAAGIKTVRLDRGHYKYHGRVAALAEAARETGLSF